MSYFPQMNVIANHCHLYYLIVQILLIGTLPTKNNFHIGSSTMKFLKLAACITSASLLIACGGDDDTNIEIPAPAINVEKAQLVLNTNAEIAYAAYTDSVVTAKALKTALAEFKADPSAAKLAAAKKAWLVAREPYGQTEVYRFRNSPVDSLDVEGDLNAWPLGEALIDYVETNTTDFGDGQVGITGNDAGINGGGAITAAQAQAAQSNNIIGNVNVTIDANLLANTLSAEDEHDVITGYHAIEFLLWGQDLKTPANQMVAAKQAIVAEPTPDPRTTDGTDRDDAINTGSTGGQRPLSDFVSEAAGDTAARRHAYLEVVVDKLIADLEAVQAEWATGSTTNYRATFTTIADAADAKKKLTEILTGMGTLSEGELAGERMQIAFSSNSQEDEHSCFSDNTHRDIWLNAEGVSNSFTGTYTGYDHDLDPTTADIVSPGLTAVDGYGIEDYLTEVGLSGIATTAAAALATTEVNYTAIDTSARTGGKPFDVLIMDANKTDTNPVAKTIISLNAQSRAIQDAANQLGLGTVVDPKASDCDTQDPTTEC
jgi:putative iron-regulated protein